jgi:hypothetical protein
MSTQAGEKGQWPFAKIPKVLFFLALRKKSGKVVWKSYWAMLQNFAHTAETEKTLHAEIEQYESGFSIRPLFKFSKHKQFY